jgi:hypothetical protein
MAIYSSGRHTFHTFNRLINIIAAISLKIRQLCVPLMIETSQFARNPAHLSAFQIDLASDDTNR